MKGVEHLYGSSSSWRNSEDSFWRVLSHTHQSKTYYAYIFTFCISIGTVIYKKNLRVHFGPYSFDMFKPLQHNDSTLNLLFSFIATLFLHLPYYILFIKLAHLSSPKRNTAHEQMAQCKQQWIYYNLTIYTYGTSVKHLSKFKWLFRMIF